MRITVPDDVAKARPRCRQVAVWLERVRSGPADGPWMAGPGSLTCDGGALAVALIADRLRVPRRLCVGLYWHTDPRVRAEILGVEPADAADWPAVLADVEASAMDEHHHWVVLWPDGSRPVLVDPNGPVRGEPYFQLARAAEGRYVELAPGQDRDLVYCPDDDLVELAERLYPGLLRRLDATRP
jgi:hypothetical protein